MKTVEEIYGEFKLLPAIARHQLRVAAVAKTICENFQGEIDTENVVLACLFHDMGNIIKSDLNYFPEFLEPEGLGYWQKIKDDFISRYGKEEHVANEEIAKEIGLPEKALSFLTNIGFSKAKIIEEGDSFEKKICNYADTRVGPYGVLSLEERLAEARTRYLKMKHAISSTQSEGFTNALRNIEKQIFAKTTIRPEDIDENRVSGRMEELKQFII